MQPAWGCSDPSCTVARANNLSSAGFGTSTAGNGPITASPIPFLKRPVAQGISGTCVFLAVFITISQITLHLRNYNRPKEQRYIVRILFIVPIYGLASWLSLLSYEGYIYFDTIRDIYEAFVIYNFLSLCFEYLGGDRKILTAINGLPIRGSWWTFTCCLSSMYYSSGFLRFCRQATLQFCFVKPIVAVITIILYSQKKFNDSVWSPKQGYLYQTIVYNFSISLALYALVMFYHATRDLLKPFDPILKFVIVKFLIFLSFWQGVFFAFAEHFGWLKTEHGNDQGVLAKGIQNFLICFEMVVAAIMLYYAFPVQPYVQGKQHTHVPSRRPWSRLKVNRKTLDNFANTVDPRDIIGDAIVSFAPGYKGYVRHPSDDVEDSGDASLHVSRHKDQSVGDVNQPGADAMPSSSRPEAGDVEDEEGVTIEFDMANEKSGLIADHASPLY